MDEMDRTGLSHPIKPQLIETFSRSASVEAPMHDGLIKRRPLPDRNVVHRRGLGMERGAVEVCGGSLNCVTVTGMCGRVVGRCGFQFPSQPRPHGAAKKCDGRWSSHFRKGHMKGALERSRCATYEPAGSCKPVGSLRHGAFERALRDASQSLPSDGPSAWRR